MRYLENRCKFRMATAVPHLDNQPGNPSSVRQDAFRNPSVAVNPSFRTWYAHFKYSGVAQTREGIAEWETQPVFRRETAHLHRQPACLL